ncbi:MAG: hypothetical protein ACHP84_13280 [Caulobacterales bacterium]
MRELSDGDSQTAVAGVALRVRWPCPSCGRMRWGSRIALAGGGGADAPPQLSTDGWSES